MEVQVSSDVPHACGSAIMSSAQTDVLMYHSDIMDLGRLRDGRLHACIIMANMMLSRGVIGRKGD
eukprot:1329450-Prorocentrum_lima.AAC.1